MLGEFLLTMVLVASIMLLGYVLRRWATDGTAAGDNKGTDQRKSTNTSAEANGLFRAVSCKGDCSAVRVLEGVRFLEREAPMFPLPGCDAITCRCTYTHHSDRRDTTRNRRSASNYEKELFETSGHPDRRGRAGRRASDLAVA